MKVRRSLGRRRGIRVLGFGGSVLGIMWRVRITARCPVLRFCFVYFLGYHQWVVVVVNLLDVLHFGTKLLEGGVVFSESCLSIVREGHAPSKPQVRLSRRR